MSSDLEMAMAKSVDDVEPVAAKQSNTGGRPKSFMRDYFASDTTSGPATCTFCKQIFKSPRSDVLIQHVLACLNAPQSIKRRAIDTAAEPKQRQKRQMKGKSSSGTPDGAPRLTPSGA